MKLKMLSLFTGIGAFEKALKNIGIECEIVGFSEIDKYAIKSYCAINNEDERKNLGDITKIDASKIDTDVDIITHGSPCQDFSVAGKQAGAEKGSGTRSSLMWYTVDIVQQIKPKYVVWENVKNILSKKHKHNFDNYIEMMNQLGYNNYYQILNAKDYGIPQNRERVYTISIRKDIDDKQFKFPEKEELRIRLKDILETEVDKKYYLSEKMQDYVLDFNNKQKGTAWEGRVDEEKLNTDIAHAIGVRSAGGNQRAGVSNFVIDGYDEEIKVKDLKVKIKNATKKGYIEATDGDSINLAYPNSKTRRGRVGNQISQTLTANDNMAVLEAPYIVASRGRNPDNPSSRIAGEHLEQRLEANTNGTTNCISTVQKDNYVVESNIKIRKLTPLECWRLMGFSDEDFRKAEKVNSNAQLYKQAGNSIVVKVLEKIFKKLFNEEKNVMDEFKEGELVVFIGRNPEKDIYTVEIGKIKKLCKDGAFVYYHTGDTAAKTDYKDLYKIRNAYAINNLGGNENHIPRID